MDLDRLLKDIIAQARSVGIPVPETISPQVAVNTRAVARFGCCRRRDGAYIVELSARLLPAGERAVRETLAHEVLHACWGCRDHGRLWKSYAARMRAAYGYEITRVGAWEAVGLAEQRPVNHLLVCERCGQEFKRAKASRLVQHPERYRCRCGGRLALKF